DAAAKKISMLDKPPQFEPNDIYGITSDSFEHQEGEWKTTIKLKRDFCIYEATHPSGHFKKIVWKKGVGLVEYASGYGAHADGYRLKREVTGQKRKDSGAYSERLTFMRFFFQLPPPVSFFIVSSLTTFVGLGGLYLVRRKYSAEVLKENHEVAAIIFNAFGLFYGVLVAFVVFATWNGYDDATKKLKLEGAESLDIFHSGEAFPDSSKQIVQQGVRNYLAGVYNDEIPKMSEGDLSVTTGGAHTPLRQLFSQLDANSIPKRELYSETLHCLNNLAQYRRMRIFAGNDTVPPVIWLVLLVGGVFAVSYTF